MKKFVTLFTDSARELKSVRTITTMAMLAAVAVILGYFSIEYGQLIRIGFSGIPNGIVDYHCTAEECYFIEMFHFLYFLIGNGLKRSPPCSG